ncbi:MAG: hypothetical protein U0Q03_19785 [Acidimicrobiales bacterium]
MSGRGRACRFVVTVAVASVGALIAAGCGSGGDSSAPTSTGESTAIVASTTSEVPASTAVATTESPATSTTEAAPTTTAAWVPPFEHGCDETSPTRAAPPTYDEAALDRFGPIGVTPAVEIAVPYDLADQPSQTWAQRVPGGMLLRISSRQAFGPLPGSMLMVLDFDGVVRWTRCLSGYVQTIVAPASAGPDAVVLTSSSGRFPSDAETVFLSLADGTEVGTLDDALAASDLPDVEVGWTVDPSGDGVAAVRPDTAPGEPIPADTVGLLDLVDLTIDAIPLPRDHSVVVSEDGRVEAWPNDAQAGGMLLFVDGRWRDTDETPGQHSEPAGFDYGAYPEPTALAGFDEDGNVTWRRDDITIPVGEGVYSAVTDGVVIAVYCATPVADIDARCDDLRSGGFSVETGETLWLDKGGFPTAFGDGAALVTGASHGHDWVMIDVHTGELIRDDEVWDGNSTLFGEECCGGDDFLRVDQFGGVLYTVADQYVRVWLPADVAGPTAYLNLSGR